MYPSLILIFSRSGTARQEEEEEEEREEQGITQQDQLLGEDCKFSIQN